MKTILYLVHAEDAMEGEIACRTLDEAYKVRAQCGPAEGRIVRIRTADQPVRMLLCNAYNRQGFVAESVEVTPDKPGSREWRGPPE